MMRSTLRSASLAAVVLCACVAATCARAQPLADRVPGDALLYLGWAGSQSMGPGYAGSHLEAVLKASDLGTLFDKTLPAFLQKIGAREREAAEVTSLVSAIGGPIWRHPTAFYFGGLDTTNPNGPPVPKFAILCDAGSEGKAMADQVRKVLADAKPPYPITVDEQGGMVAVFAGIPGYGAGKKPAGALAQSATFQAALAQVGKDSTVAAYVDLEAAVKLVDKMAGGNPQGAQQWGKVRDALGLNGVRRIIYTAGFDGKDWMSQCFVDAPAPRTGALASLFDAKPLSDDLLKTIPQSATLAAAGRFDLGGLINRIRDVATNLEPAAGQAIADGLAQVKQMTGIDIQADLLAHLGDEWAIYTDPMAGGNGILGFALVHKARDAAKLEASVTKLEDLANKLLKENLPPDGPQIAFRQATVDGTNLHYLPVPLVTPAWAARDGNIYAGLYPQVVTAAAAQGAARDKSILDNPAYQAVRKRLGVTAAPSGVSFANLPVTAPEAYQELLMMSRLYLGIADLFGADTPPMLVPPLAKIMPHLSPAGGVSWSDDKGWHSKSVVPFPGAGALTPGGGGQMLIAQNAMLASILLPSLNRARETANRVKCASNMRQIGQGIMLYANDNKGKYPPDLGTILVTQDLTAEVFVCPSGNTSVPHTNPPGNDAQAMEKWRKDMGAWVTQNADYVYVGKGLTTTAGAEVVVLYEKPHDHGQQGMNFLFADGHVEWCSMPQAQQLIQKAQQPK